MIQTLTDILFNTVENLPKEEFILYKKQGQIMSISMAEFGRQVKEICLGLYSLGFRAGDKLCLLSENRPEWTMTDFGVLCAGGLTVPIYSTLVREQIQYMVDDSDSSVVVVSKPDLWEKIAPLRPKLDKVKHYVVFDGPVPDGAISLEELTAKGRALDAEKPGLFRELASAVKPESEASLIYTSGTTGSPKGVVLTHANFLSNIRPLVEMMGLTAEDNVLSFLPLSHVLERMVMFAYVSRGSTIAFAESIEAVARNLIDFRPTIMVSVPRVFEKIYTKIMDQILNASMVERRVFFWAIKAGKKAAAAQLAGRPIKPGTRLNVALARKLVFAKITARTGGRVRFFISGGAPLSRDIAEFFYAIGLVIFEGYGLTETSPVIAVNSFGQLRFGTVGRPLPGVEVRIAEDGEILARGPNVMKGYYKKDAATREVMAGGWFHTGDIGHVDEDGFLAITDRKKDLIITSGGKNVAPQPIENMIKLNPYIANIVIIGNKRRFCSALVVPDFEKLGEYARAHGIFCQNNAELVGDVRIVQFLKSEIDNATPHLASYETIKKIIVLARDFTIDEGEMTPTQKIRRAIIEEKYRDLIDGLYKEESPDAKEGNGN